MKSSGARKKKVNRITVWPTGVAHHVDVEAIGAPDSNLDPNTACESNKNIDVDREELSASAMDLLNNLKIPCTSLSRNLEEGAHYDTSFALVSHVIQCVGVLRDLLKISKGATSDAKQSSSVIFRVLNALTGELGKIMLYAMTNDWQSAESTLAESFLRISDEVISCFPEMVMRKHKTTKKMLLHHVCSTAKPVVSQKSLKLLINTCPQSCATVDSSGAIPLHWIMKNKDATADAVQLLISRYPDGVKVRDIRGQLPLHWATQAGSTNGDIVTILLKAYAAGAGVRDEKGNTPLHICLSRSNPPQDVVKILCRAHKEALSAGNNEGNIPLHCLCEQHRPDVSVLRYVLSRYPYGAVARNQLQQVPLHRLVDMEKPSVHAFHTLVAASRECVEYADADGYLPLHSVLDYADPHMDIVTRLIDLYPDSLKVLTMDGYLPLHIAISANKLPNEDMVRKIVALYPASVNHCAIDLVSQVSDDMSSADESTAAEHSRRIQPPPINSDWIECKWTPYSRAQERGLVTLISIMKPYADDVTLTGASISGSLSGEESRERAHTYPATQGDLYVRPRSREVEGVTSEHTPARRRSWKRFGDIDDMEHLHSGEKGTEETSVSKTISGKNLYINTSPFKVDDDDGYDDEREERAILAWNGERLQQVHDGESSSSIRGSSEMVRRSPLFSQRGSAGSGINRTGFCDSTGFSDSPCNLPCVVRTASDWNDRDVDMFIAHVGSAKGGKDTPKTTPLTPARSTPISNMPSHTLVSHNPTSSSKRDPMDLCATDARGVCGRVSVPSISPAHVPVNQTKSLPLNPNSSPNLESSPNPDPIPSPGTTRTDRNSSIMSASSSESDPFRSRPTSTSSLIDKRRQYKPSPSDMLKRVHATFIHEDTDATHTSILRKNPQMKRGENSVPSIESLPAISLV